MNCKGSTCGLIFKWHFLHLPDSLLNCFQKSFLDSKYNKWLRLTKPCHCILNCQHDQSMYHMQMIYKFTGDNYDRDLTIAKATAQLRQEFEKNRHVKDLRVIDILCVKVTAFCSFCFKFMLTFHVNGRIFG